MNNPFIRTLPKIVLILIITVLSLSSLACSCVGKSSVKEGVHKSNIVFSGKILTKNVFVLDDSILPKGLKLYQTEYKILVAKVYKGKMRKDTISLITGIGKGDCGFEFKVGNDYIVYSNYKDKYFTLGKRVKKFLYTDICTRTKPFDENEHQEILKYTRN